MKRTMIEDAVVPAGAPDGAGGLRLAGEGSMLGEVVKAVLERALEAELTAQLGYEKSERGGLGVGPAGSARNGKLFKTVQTGVGPVPLQVPRDRAGTFEPLLSHDRCTRAVRGGCRVSRGLWMLARRGALGGRVR